MSNPITAARWSSAIESRPELRQWITHNPRFVLKPSRHYISREYSFSERVAVIKNHYSMITQLISPPNTLRLATGHALTLARVIGKRGGTYSITLRKTDKFDREGELILGLRDTGRQCEVFYLVFSLNKGMGSPCLEIGCIQGPQGANARELIKAATKDCLGIRPKDLLLESSLFLAKAWNIAEIFGASNETRVYKSALTFADYNALWSSIGGVLDRNGMFRLPNALKHHDLAEVPSHHRSEYRKRMALRRELAKQIEVSVNSLSSAGMCSSTFLNIAELMPES